MSEDEVLFEPEKNETISEDADDYFPFTAFQKQAKITDSGHVEEWESAVSNTDTSFETEDDSFLMAKIADRYDVNLRFVYKDKKNSDLITGELKQIHDDEMIHNSIVQLTIDSIKNVVPKLSYESRKHFFDMLVQLLPSFKNSGREIVQEALQKLSVTVLSEEKNSQPEKGENFFERKSVPIFEIAITNAIRNKEDLESALQNLPRPEPMPEIKVGMPKAEFVQLKDVVGGNNMDNWSVSSEQGRGLDKIHSIVESFQNGTLNVNGEKVPPIQVRKVNGKYYVDGDGRHRVAALKVLGVDKVPMMVKSVLG